jgi:hypothetical protein
MSQAVADHLLYRVREWGVRPGHGMRLSAGAERWRAR